MATSDVGSELYTAVFNEATAAQHDTIPDVTGMRARLRGCALYADGNVDVTIEESGGTDMIGPCALSVTTPLVLSIGANWGTVGTDSLGISVLLGGAVQVTGVLVYDYVMNP